MYKANTSLNFVFVFSLFLFGTNPLFANPLPDGTLLTIQPGTVSGSECVSGSCLGVIVAGTAENPTISWRALTPGSDGGIVIGENQQGGGQNLNSTSTASGEIAVAALVLSNKISLATIPISGLTSDSGQATTGSNLNIFDDASCNDANCNGKTELGTMHLAFGNNAFTFGSANGCVKIGGGTGCSVNQLAGVFVSNWTVNSDGTYALDYSQITLRNASGTFPGNSPTYLHLEGNIVLPGAPQFSEQSGSAGIGHIINENSSADVGGGTGWIDYNNDGYYDLFIPNALDPITNPAAANGNRTTAWFYHNNGDGTFTERAIAAGFNSEAPGTGVAVADYDGDGCDDMLVLNGTTVGGVINGTTIFNQQGGRKNTLYRNNFCDSGALTFTDVTSESRLIEAQQSIVASFGDVNGDGYLDLYVGNYFPGGNVDAANFNNRCAFNHFYLNNQDGTFTEMAASLGIDNTGCTLAVTMTDFDQDGDLDIYVSNDFSPGAAFTQLVDPDVIYENLGVTNGVPSFQIANVNLTDAENGMGIAVGDYDNDRDLDYYVSNMSNDGGASDAGNLFGRLTNKLNTNAGNNIFEDKAELLNVADIDPNDSIFGVMVGWGAAFFDVDSDGWLDLYKVNGTIGSAGGLGPNPVQPNRLFINNQGINFTEAASLANVDAKCVIDCYFSSSHGFGYDHGRSVALADYDNDGDLDMFVHNLATLASSIGGVGMPKLYRNETNTNNHFLKLNLKGRNPNHRAIGAKVFLDTSDGLQQMREVHAGTGHATSHAFPVFFGVPESSTIQSLRVEWSSGCSSDIAIVSLLDKTAGVDIIEDDVCPEIPTTTIDSFSIDPDYPRWIQIVGTNLEGSRIRVDGVMLSSSNVFISTGDTIIDAFVPGVQSGVVELITDSGIIITVGNYTSPPPPVFSLNSWSSNTNTPTLLQIKGSKLVNITSILINGLPVFIYNADPTLITVVGFNAAGVNAVTVTSSTEGSLTLSAIPTIDTVEVYSNPNWSLIRGNGFQFGVTSVSVDNSPAPFQVNNDRTIIVAVSKSVIDSGNIKVITAYGVACKGTSCS